jgi:hypothetical protein
MNERRELALHRLVRRQPSQRRRIEVPLDPPIGALRRRRDP